MLNKNFETVETGMKELVKGVEIRDKMGGAMYWSVLNDECCAIGNKLLTMGGEYEVIGSIIGKDNFN